MTLAMVLVPTRPEVAGREVAVEAGIDMTATALPVRLTVRVPDGSPSHDFTFEVGDRPDHEVTENCRWQRREAECWYAEAIRASAL